MDPQCFLDLFFEQMIKGASSSGIVVVITPRLKIACNYLILYEYEFIGYEMPWFFMNMHEKRQIFIFIKINP